MKTKLLASGVLAASLLLGGLSSAQAYVYVDTGLPVIGNVLPFTGTTLVRGFYNPNRLVPAGCSTYYVYSWNAGKYVPVKGCVGTYVHGWRPNHKVFYVH